MHQLLLITLLFLPGISLASDDSLSSLGATLSGKLKDKEGISTEHRPPTQKGLDIVRGDKGYYFFIPNGNGAKSEIRGSIMFYTSTLEKSGKRVNSGYIYRQFNLRGFDPDLNSKSGPFYTVENFDKDNNGGNSVKNSGPQSGMDIIKGDTGYFFFIPNTDGWKSESSGSIVYDTFSLDESTGKFVPNGHFYRCFSLKGFDPKDKSCYTVKNLNGVKEPQIKRTYCPVCGNNIKPRSYPFGRISFAVSSESGRKREVFLKSNDCPCCSKSKNYNPFHAFKSCPCCQCSKSKGSLNSAQSNGNKTPLLRTSSINPFLAFMMLNARPTDKPQSKPFQVMRQYDRDDMRPKNVIDGASAKNIVKKNLAGKSIEKEVTVNMKIVPLYEKLDTNTKSPKVQTNIQSLKQDEANKREVKDLITSLTKLYNSLLQESIAPKNTGENNISKPSYSSIVKNGNLNSQNAVFRSTPRALQNSGKVFKTYQEPSLEELSFWNNLNGKSSPKKTNPFIYYL